MPHNRRLIRILPVILILFTASIAYAQTVKDMYEMAVDNYNNGKYAPAIDQYKKIIQGLPSFAPAYNGLALTIKASGGDIQEAIQDLKTAIHYDPRYAQAYENLGRIYYEQQDFDEAQVNFEKALLNDPNLMDSKMSLAWIYLLTKDKPNKAVNLFKAVLKSSQSPNVYFGLGLAYFANNQRIDAMEMITKLRNMGRDDLASRLEKSVRENQHVALREETVKNGENQKDATAGQATAPVATGIKVRLREKLPDII